MYFMERVTKEKGLEGCADRLMGANIGKKFKKYGPEVEEYDYCLLTFNDGTREAIFHFLKSFSCLGSVCCVYYADKEFWSNKEYMENFETFDKYWSSISSVKKADNVEVTKASNGKFDFDPDFIEWLKSEGESLVHRSRYDAWCRFIDNNTKCVSRYYSKCDFVYAILYMQRLCDKESIFDIALDFHEDSNAGLFEGWLVRRILFAYSYRGPELSYLTYNGKFSLHSLGNVLLKIMENKKLYSKFKIRRKKDNYI